MKKEQTFTFSGKQNILLFLALVVGLLLSEADKSIANEKKQSRTVSEFQSEFIFPEQNQHVHSSSMVELSNGDLLCCWFQGSGERTANDVQIKGARLKKGETHWSEPFVLADTPNYPDCNPILFIDANNRLHLVWIVVIANRWESSVLKTRISSDYLGEGAPKWNWQDIILLKPGDDFAQIIESKFRETEIPERAWAEYAPLYEKMIAEAAKDPKKTETGWMTRIKPLILSSGKILLPLYSDGFNISLVAISEDNGDTWKSSQPVVGRGNIQPALIRKNDGTLVAYMRDNGDAPGRIFISTSADEGINWTPAVKSDIPNPGSSLDVLTLDNGNWAMIYNDLEDGRRRLAVSLSDDEGKTWKWKNYLEIGNTGDERFAYPSIIQTHDGFIHASYSHHLKQGKTIKHVKFTANWIKETTEKTTNAEKLGFPKGKKILLLHMDDAGMCDEANQAVQAYIQSGNVISAAVMMPCPNAAEMVEWAKQNPGGDIGVHLTLTSEWKTYRWPSVTDPAKVPGLIDPDGKLWHDVPDVVKHATPQEVETEIRAQIDKMLNMGYKPSHIDTHMGTLYGSAEFVKVFLKVAEEYNIPANAIDLSDPDVAAFYRKAGYPVTDEVINILGDYKLPKLDNFGSVPNGKTYEEKRENFFQLIRSLKPGVTEIIFHPSVYSENLKGITGSWQQRVWEAQMFSDPVVLNFFSENEIIFTNWGDIMKRFNKKY